MNPDSILLSRGTEADIAFVMATERLPGYDKLVGHWSEPQHRAALCDERYAYFIACVAAEQIGFAIVRDWASAEHVACIKRIAVARPGAGYGKPFLAHLVDRIFSDTDAHRVWLGVFPDNARARRVYEGVGFKPEGIARGSAFFGGVYRDELIMALLRPEWSASRRR
jgi:RimJ/RimL family protein N-acetyltransferase